MKQPKNHSELAICPKEFRHTPDMTGYYTFDIAIQKGHNKDMAAKLEDHLMSDLVYQKNTAYNHTSND